MAAIESPDYLGTLTEVPEVEIPTEVTATFKRREPKTGELVKVTETRETLKAFLGMHVSVDLYSDQPKKRGRKASGVIDPVTAAVNEAMAFAYSARENSELTFEIAFGAHGGKQQVSAKGRCAAFVASVCDAGSHLAIEVADPSQEVPEATVIEITTGPKAGWTSDQLGLPDEDEDESESESEVTGLEGDAGEGEEADELGEGEDEDKD